MASLALASPSGDLAVGDAAIVVIDNFTFNPSKLSVQTGIAVTWVNHDAG
jgi:plastocyanin